MSDLLQERARGAAHDPQYLFGQWNIDYEKRVDFDRLRRERIDRIHASIQDADTDIGALLLYHPDLIRYVTSSRYLTLAGYPRFFRYALIPRGRPPILFEIAGAEMDHRLMTAPWLKGRIRPAIIWNYAGPATEALAQRWVDDLKAVLQEEGVQGKKLAVDRIDLPMFQALQRAEIEVVDAWPIVNSATKVKTRDELELLKTAAAIMDAAFYRAEQAIAPGVRECDLYGIVAQTLVTMGIEYVPGVVVASGGHTLPYLRDCTDKMIRYGDLVIIDIWGQYAGYHTDSCRTFICGEPTAEQRRLYRQCLDMLERVIGTVRPGATTADVARALEVDVDDRYKTLSMLQFAHGLGVTLHDPPLVTRGYSLEYPMMIEANMYMAAETYASDGMQGVRLERDFVVTDDGIQPFDLYPWDRKLLG